MGNKIYSLPTTRTGLNGNLLNKKILSETDLETGKSKDYTFKEILTATHPIDTARGFTTGNVRGAMDFLSRRHNIERHSQELIDNPRTSVGEKAIDQVCYAGWWGVYGRVERS
jgi:hypothetical protein